MIKDIEALLEKEAPHIEFCSVESSPPITMDKDDAPEYLMYFHFQGREYYEGRGQLRVVAPLDARVVNDEYVNVPAILVPMVRDAYARAVERYKQEHGIEPIHR
jgi:hypothetical protein